MSYAVKSDMTSFRAVIGPDKRSEEFPDGLTDDEINSLEVPVLVPPSPTAEEVLALANAQRDLLLGEASLRIAPLQDAVDLGEATDDEAASLKAWKQYRVAVNRVHLQPGWPDAPAWPGVPT